MTRSRPLRCARYRIHLAAACRTISFCASAERATRRFFRFNSRRPAHRRQMPRRAATLPPASAADDQHDFAFHAASSSRRANSSRTSPADARLTSSCTLVSSRQTATSRCGNSSAPRRLRRSRDATRAFIGTQAPRQATRACSGFRDVRNLLRGKNPPKKKTRVVESDRHIGRDRREAPPQHVDTAAFARTVSIRRASGIGHAGHARRRCKRHGLACRDAFGDTPASRDGRLVEAFEALLDAEMGEQFARNARVLGAHRIGACEAPRSREASCRPDCRWRRTYDEASCHGGLLLLFSSLCTRAAGSKKPPLRRRASLPDTRAESPDAWRPMRFPRPSLYMFPSAMLPHHERTKTPRAKKPRARMMGCMPAAAIPATQNAAERSTRHAAAGIRANRW